MPVAVIVCATRAARGRRQLGREFLRTRFDCHFIIARYEMDRGVLGGFFGLGGWHGIWNEARPPTVGQRAPDGGDLSEKLGVAVFAVGAYGVGP
jgi:hypothetical protein